MRTRIFFTTFLMGFFIYTNAQDETVNGNLTVTGNTTIDGNFISGQLLAKPFSSSDLNNTFITSNRQVSLTSGGYKSANRPSTAGNYFSTLNLRHATSSDYQSQISMGSYNSGLFFRSKVNGAWQPWKEALTTSGGVLLLGI